MANKLISTMKMPDGTAYDIDAKYLGGYEADEFAKVEDLDSKADVYEIVNFQTITTSTNLAGKTISGVSNKVLSLSSFSSTIITLTGLNGATSYKIHMGGAMGEIVLKTASDEYVYDENGQPVYFYHGYDGQDGQYSGISYTFPSVGEIYMANNNFLEYFIIKDTVPVDCEYNYNNKANVYTADGTKKLSEVQVGENLSGVTLIFDTSTYPYVGSYIDFVTKDSSCPAYSKYRLGNRDDYGPGSGGYQFGLMEFVQMSEDGGWYQLLDYSNSNIFFNDNGSGGTDGWQMSSFTMPVSTGDDFVVKNVYIGTEESNFLDAIKYGGTTTVDCEYNYNQIQALKANNGIYKHNIEIDTGNPYFVYVDIYTSSSTSITTASQLFAILGTKQTAGSYNGMDGYGTVTFNFNSAGTAITVYGVVASGTTVNTVNLSNQTISRITDTVKKL